MSHSERQREIFDPKADVLAKPLPDNIEAKLAKIAQSVPLNEQSRVLDFGSGASHFALLTMRVDSHSIAPSKENASQVLSCSSQHHTASELPSQSTEQASADGAMRLWC
jgi:cyclopropane fatty-acyl-phospholipid synthase-like methyltransferase